MPRQRATGEERSAMKRAILIVKGEVQRVGYRDVVAKIARKLSISGFVENLKPYDVKIVAEGSDANITQFIEQLKIKRFPIDVESVEVSFEPYKHEFEYFEIKRGDWREELFERLDTAGALLYKSVELGEKSVELGEKSVALGERSVALSERSVELGEKSVALGERSVELGEKSVALGEKSVELGERSVALSERSVELGEKSVALGERSVELGEKSVALGEKLVALSERSVELGEKSVALGEESVSIGKRMLEKQDATIEAIEQSKNEIVTEIRSLREDLRSYMEDKFAKIEHEIEAIKAKIGMV
ncbi:MAG: acylphosphatase [Methanophagales archaeon]|nr:acylphosphatase [Methanophagales archaeon]